MRNLLIIALLCGLWIFRTDQILAQQSVAVSEANGTWQAKNGTLKVWALDNERLQVEFSGLHEYRSSAGVMVNTGTAKGVARIEGSLATLRPDGAEAECVITMQFGKPVLVVEQQSTCGLGLNVTAAGQYRKVSTP